MTETRPAERLRQDLKLMSPAELASLAGCSELSVRREITLGRLSATSTPSGTFIADDTARKFLSKEVRPVRTRDGWFQPENWSYSAGDLRQRLSSATSFEEGTRIVARPLVARSEHPIAVCFAATSIRDRLSYYISKRRSGRVFSGGGSPIERLFGMAPEHFAALINEIRDGVRNEPFTIAGERFRFGEIAGPNFNAIWRTAVALAV